MLRYLVQRLWQGALVMLGVSALVFVLIRLSGDPIALMLPPEATAEDHAEMRERLALDRPLHEQYLSFLMGVARGDFGDSLRHRRPAMELVLERIPATLQLSAGAVVVSLLIAVPLGMLGGLRSGTMFDRVGMLAAVVGQSIPTFWLGIFLILVVSVRLGWLPTMGRGGIRYLILPSITLGVYSAALTARLLRTSLAETMSQGYIRTARSKGLSEMRVILGHALRNASIPVITALALQVGVLMGGAIITETVFGYPGIGLLAIQAIRNRDFPVVQAFVTFLAAIIVTLNVVVDILYAYVDPRIRYD